MNKYGLQRALRGGYVPPVKREACRTCKHGELRMPEPGAEYQDRKRIHCAIWKTDLNLGGICPKHEK